MNSDRLVLFTENEENENHSLTKNINLQTYFVLKRNENISTHFRLDYERRTQPFDGFETFVRIKHWPSNLPVGSSDCELCRQTLKTS